MRIAAAVGVLLHAAVGATAAGGDGPTAGMLRALVRAGETAPAFTLQGLDGRIVSVKPGDGKPSLVVFFSAFCPLCRELAPSLEEIAAGRGRTLRVIAVNLDGKRFSNAVRSFVKEFGIGFPVLLDEIRDDMFVASDPFGVEKTPTAVLIDGRGAVRGAWAGEAMRDFVRDSDQAFAALEKGNRPAN